jgi:hypothetical protein
MFLMRRSSVIGLVSAVFRLPPLLPESPAALARLFLVGRCAQISRLARPPAISLRNGHSGGEGLHARRPTLLPQADGSGRFYHSGLPQGDSRQAFSRVPLRAGQPGGNNYRLSVRCPRTLIAQCGFWRFGNLVVKISTESPRCFSMNVRLLVGPLDSAKPIERPLLVTGHRPKGGASHDYGDRWVATMAPRSRSTRGTRSRH